MPQFRFAFWPTAITVPAVLIMVALGIWQIERLAWKTDLLDRIHARITGEPAPLDKLSGDPAQDEYRRVRLTGRFLNDKEMYLAARSLNGNVGYQVVTPLILADGKAVLVNRGWIPQERKDPAKRAQGEIEGDTSLDAVVRLSQKSGWMTPDNEPGRNIWFYVDVPAMTKWAGVAGESSYWFEAGKAANPGGLPIGGQTRVDIPNDHLQYAITWFIFAVTLIVIYLIYSRRLAQSQPGGG